MRPWPIACAAILLAAGTTLATDLYDPPAPPAPPAAPLPPPPPPPPPDLLGMGGRALRELDLSDDQHARLHNLLELSRDNDLGATMETVHRARRALERALWDPKAGDAEIATLRGRMVEAEDRLLAVRRQVVGEVLKLLTEEQRAQLQQSLDAPRAWGRPRP